MARPDNSHSPRQFNAPIPGQGLTDKAAGTPWQQPPKYPKLGDACNYVFNQITQPAKLQQLLAMLDHGVPLEAVARLVIHAGFQTGLWTPDVGMLMSRPVMYMLAGIAQRAGKNPKLTHADRSGMKELVHMKSIFMTNNPSSVATKKPVQAPDKPMRGLMQPPAGVVGQ